MKRLVHSGTERTNHDATAPSTHSFHRRDIIKETQKTKDGLDFLHDDRLVKYFIEMGPFLLELTTHEKKTLEFVW